jgi:two-component system, NtrC family, sensor kinase
MALPSRSVRTEIVVGFATVILAFGSVATYSLLRQQRAVASMRLANESYLPLATQITELRVNQDQFNTLLGDLVDMHDRANYRAWLTTASRLRRDHLAVTIELVHHARQSATDPADVALLSRVTASMAALNAGYIADGPLVEALFAALAQARPEAAQRAKNQILAREVPLGRLTRDLQARVQFLTDDVEHRQRQSFQLTLSAIAVACILGSLSTLTALRALRPLALLRDRARAVARGDLAPASIQARPDEIGELAGEFERMVQAVSARDEALRAAQKKILQAERLAAIGRMAAHVTHEVRNPLSSIALNAEMLADEVRAAGASTQESERLMQAIQREVDRLTLITEEYLRVARLPKPKLERESLGDLTADAVTFVEQEMRAARVRVKFTVDEGVPPAMLDESQVRQAILNLLRNAREAMESAQCADPRIDVHVYREGPSEIAVAICDTGAGLSAEASAHLFELFFTTRPRGSGLGLALTREIVEAHSGTIHADRAPPERGGGARFVMRFPVIVDNAAKVSETSTHA